MLSWSELRSCIEKALKPCEYIRVLGYELLTVPVPKTMDERTYKTLKMTVCQAALVGLMDCYVGGLLDPSVTVLEVHKLMYFMQEAGEPLRLKYRKARYGPNAENLRHVLNVIEGHLISGYSDGGDATNKPIQLMPGAVEVAAAVLQQYPETRDRFERVTALVEGFESAFGLELLSTVHWVMKNEAVDSIDDVVKRTYAWGDHKRKFTSRQIVLAVDMLMRKQCEKLLEK